MEYGRHCQAENYASSVEKEMKTINLRQDLCSKKDMQNLSV